MQQQIKLLRDILDKINNDASTSMQYYTGPCLTKTPMTGPVYNVKWLLIEDILHKTQHGIERSDDCSVVDKHVEDIFNNLNHIYTRTQQHCWPSHAHHFHTSFREYVNCPITCLPEISEYLDKITKELYHT